MPIDESSREWLDLFSGRAEARIELTLLSGSMSPALIPGDIVEIRPLRGSERERLHRGDIVVFRSGSALVSHRLILSLCGGRLLLEKGDSVDRASFLKKKLVVGRVEEAIREGRLVYSRSPESLARDRGEARLSLLRFLFRGLPKGLMRRSVKHGL